MPCMQPITMAWKKPTFPVLLAFLLLTYSATSRNTAVIRKLTPRNQPVSQLSMKSSKITLNTSVGMEAMKSSRSVLDLKGFLRISHQSFQNTMITGMRVPTCRRISSIL